MINGRLYNTAAAERAQPPDVQVIRQDGPNSYPPVGTYRVDVGSGAFWSHARFLGIGFYWSELDLVGNGAKPYAVNVIDGFRTQLFHMGMPITASAFTFLEDTFRGQLFTFASFSGGGIAVGCTTNGWSVNAVEPL